MDIQGEKFFELLAQFKKDHGNMRISTVLLCRVYYYAVDSYIQQGYKRSEAVTWVADDFGVSETTIYLRQKIFSEIVKMLKFELKEIN